MPVKHSTEAALRAAMTRLLDGKPVALSGKLTDQRLAAEAGVSRSTLVRSGTFYEEWRQAKATRGTKRASKPSLSSSNADSNYTALRQTIEILANKINALTLTLRQRDEQIVALTGQLAQGGVHVSSIAQGRRR